MNAFVAEIAADAASTGGGGGGGGRRGGGGAGGRKDAAIDAGNCGAAAAGIDGNCGAVAATEVVVDMRGVKAEVAHGGQDGRGLNSEADMVI